MKSAEVVTVGGTPIHYLGKSDLIRAKQTASRLQDLADIDELRRAGPD